MQFVALRSRKSVIHKVAARKLTVHAIVTSVEHQKPGGWKVVKAVPCAETNNHRTRGNKVFVGKIPFKPGDFVKFKCEPEVNTATGKQHAVLTCTFVKQHKDHLALKGTS